MNRQDSDLRLKRYCFSGSENGRARKRAGHRIVAFAFVVVVVDVVLRTTRNWLNRRCTARHGVKDKQGQQ